MEFGLGLVTPDPECASGECDGFVAPHAIPSAQTAAVNTMFPSVTASSPASNEPPEDDDGLPNLSFPAYMQGIYTTWCLVLLLVGLAGNILVPVLVLRDRELRGASTSIFIVNLVAADLLVLVVCLPALLCELYAPPDVWVLPPSMCKYQISILTHFLLLILSRGTKARRLHASLSANFTYLEGKEGISSFWACLHLRKGVGFV